MKKVFKLLTSLLVAAILLTSLLTVGVSAASVTVGGGTYNVGQKVNVSVKFNADATLYAVQVDASYNSSVLRLDSVSGADYTKGNGTIKIVDDNFSAAKPSKTASYTLSFTAIAAGNSKITVSVLGGGEATSKASSSANITVVTPKPSSNANLASITVDGVSLTPAFSSGVTKYSATVKNSVANVNIKGSVADGGATYVGGGSWDLKEGDNSRTLTVTAADGSKKSYTVNIKRMTIEETAKAEQEAREANPLLVIINNIDYTIVNDITKITVPAGFTQGTADRKDSQVTVLNDEKDKYQLYCLADEEGNIGYYTRDNNDVFTRINYINAGGKMYIIESFDADITLPKDYVAAIRNINGIDVAVYNYSEEAMKDFYIVRCYIGGNTSYYSVDSAEGTIQRAVLFDLALKNPTDTDSTVNTAVDNTENNGIKIDLFGWLPKMTGKAKIVFLAIMGAAVLLIIIAVILIVKIASSGKKDSYEEKYDEINNFVLDDGSIPPPQNDQTNIKE